MDEKKIDEMLEQLKEKRSPQADSFCSVEQFKEKFYQKVNEPERKTFPVLKWALPVSIAACLVIGFALHVSPDSPEVMSGAPRKLESVPSAPAVKNSALKEERVLNSVKPMEPPVRYSASPSPTYNNRKSFRGKEKVARKISVSPARRLMRKNSQRAKVARKISVSPAMAARERVKLNTEEYKSITENPFLRVVGNPLSTFGADVDTASYTNVRRFLKAHRLPPKDAVRIEEFVNFFRYDYPAPKQGEKFSVTYESMSAPWNKNHKLLLIGVQGMDIPMKELPPANYVFLVDNSGSMYQEIELVIEALSTLIDQMRDQDKISLVTYGGGVNVLLDGISGSQKAKAKNLVKQLRSGGYTPGSAGIQTAYKLAHKHFVQKGNNRIILITDGDFNVGVSSESELVAMVEKERNSMIYLSTFGVGYGNYQENKLKMLSNKGNGNYFYLDNMKEARKAMKACFAGRMFTLAKDVKFQVEFNPAKVSEYRLLGYELRKLADRDFNDDSKDSGEVGVGHQVTVLYELIPASVKSPASGNVDPLKYQNSSTAKSDEILTCKLRYQNPVEKQASVLRVFPLKSFPAAGENIQWASAAAEFAMLLRDSSHKGNASYGSVLNRAKKYLGKDPDGKRAEFLTLVHDAKDINK